jgi:hypothetical protein
LKYIESPNRRIEWNTLRNKATPFIKWLLPPIVLASALIVLSNNYWFNSDIRNMAVETSAEPLMVNCTEMIADFGIGSEVCTWPSSGSGEPIYLVGDSVAAQYANMLREIAETKGRPIIVATHPACPFLGVSLYYNKAGHITDDVECQKANLEFGRILSESPPGHVILASSSVPFFSDARAVGYDNDLPVVAKVEKAKMLERGLMQLIDSLSLSGHSVSVIQSTPEYFVRAGDYVPLDQWSPSVCSGLALANVNVNCGTSRSGEQLDVYQGPSRSAITKAANSRESRVLDPRDTLCINGNCSTNEGSTWFYRDGVHLSANGVNVLRPELESLLK